MERSQQRRRALLTTIMAILLATSVGIGAPSSAVLAAGRCATSTGSVSERVANFWQCVGALSDSDYLLSEDLGGWARNVIELDASACISVGGFRGLAGTMQSAMDRASAGIPPAPPKSADVETRIAAFWSKVDALGSFDFLAAGDLGQWALNVIDRDPSRQIRVDDFRTSTAGMQGAFDRARAAGAACKPPAPPATTAPPAPATLTVTITNSRYGLVAATTLLGATCTAQAVLPSGRVSTAQGLQGSRTADASGNVAFSYQTQSNTTPGAGTHTVTCSYQGQTKSASAPFSVP
jgi:hypothetical protein